MTSLNDSYAAPFETSTDTEENTEALTSNDYLSQDTLSASSWPHRLLDSASFSQRTVLELVESKAFNISIIVIIILNALALGIETDITAMKYYGWYLDLLNNVFLGIYLFELCLKLYSLRLNYLKSGWNIFDMFIILLSLIAWIVKENVNLGVELTKLFSIIRIFRAILIIRFIKELKEVPYLRSLQLIIETIFSSFLTIGSIGLLAGIFLYVFTIASVILFGDVYPEKFGTVGIAFVSLFQVITLDRWSEMYTNNTNYKSIWVLGFVIIIFETFVFENLFVAVIINNLKGSRELVELKKKKRMVKMKKFKADHRTGSKTTLKMKKSTPDGLGSLFDQQHGIDDYYPPYLSNRLKELLSSYYMNLAAIDHAQECKTRQEKVLDDLIELTINYQNKEFD